jgi:hypothetical protein
LALFSLASAFSFLASSLAALASSLSFFACSLARTLAAFSSALAFLASSFSFLARALAATASSLAFFLAALSKSFSCFFVIFLVGWTGEVSLDGFATTLLESMLEPNAGELVVDIFEILDSFSYFILNILELIQFL